MTDPHKEFVSEATALIQNTEDALLDLRDSAYGPSAPALLNQIFRSIHTLKGVAGLFGFKDISHLTHALESMLDELRLGKRPGDEPTISFLLSKVDVLKRLVSMPGDESSAHEVQEALSDILAFRSERHESDLEGDSRIQEIPESIRKVLSEYEESRLRQILRQGWGVFAIEVEYEIASFEEKLRTLTGHVGSVGELIATMPRSSDAQPGNIGFSLILGASMSKEDVEGRFKGLEVREVAGPGASPTPGMKPALGPGRPSASALRGVSNTIRVELAKLDALLSTFGELLFLKEIVNRVGHDFIETYGYVSEGGELQEASKSLDKHLKELQRQILEIRMVPVGQIFARLARIVRRYTQDRGSTVDLLLYGEETEIDAELAEEVIDPLMHIVRNAIDHGIEPPEVREKAGKSRKGVVTLRAFPRGGRVVFRITDDGAGIHTERVLQVARERGVVKPGAMLTQEEIVQLIFEPALSTASMVSELSGRGVGLDVVREKISSLGGFVEVETERGKGTAVQVTVPITLAVIKTILVNVAGETLAVPLASVSETLVMDESQVQYMDDREVLNLRGDRFPLVRLRDIFDLPSENSSATFYVVVAGFGNRRVGFAVDDLIGQQDIVIKPLGPYLKAVRGIAGAAEVGRQRMLLVLDAEALMEEALISASRTRPGMV